MTGHAYSKTGLMKLQYTCTVLKSLNCPPFRLNILKAYRCLLALEDMCLMQRRNGHYTVMHCAGVFSQIKNFACDRQKIKHFRRFFSC